MRWRFRRRATRSSAATGRRRPSLQVRPSPLAHVQAITHFARALGAARSGNPEAAKADIAKLGELRDKLLAAKDAYWSEQVDIQAQVASAWVLYAEGKHDDALKAMSAAADAEDKTEKHPVTPGVPKPARELYGVMLLERGMAEGSARRLRGDAEEGAEPARRLCGRGEGRREVRRRRPRRASTTRRSSRSRRDADKTRTEVADARAFLRRSPEARRRRGTRRESAPACDRAGCARDAGAAPSRSRSSAMPACSASGS